MRIAAVRATAPPGRGLPGSGLWAHSVIAGGVLYIRHGDVLMAFDVADGG